MASSVIGTKVGMLSILGEEKKNNRLYYYCKCDCGNFTWVRSDSITGKRVTKSCGCLAKNSFFKIKDIRNKKFGRLKAIEPTDRRYKSNGSVIWKCICECGNIAYIEESSLSNGAIKSCGCLGKESSSLNMRKALKVHLENNIVDGTNIKIISRKHTQSNNTSGVTGVTWDKNRQKWVAQIRFKNKQYHLGRFDSKEEAIKVRKEAEGKLFNQFLVELNYI